MPTLNDILSLPNGARFYRADLHIHSFGSSHDVKDVTMIPDGIVKTAVAEGLDVVAVADHNEIINVEATITAAKGHDLLVIPAVELSTADGHLLCYLPTLDALKKYLASLSIVDHDIADAAREEEQARDELLAVQGEIETATKNVELIPQYERMLSTTQQQLA